MKIQMFNIKYSGVTNSPNGSPVGTIVKKDMISKRRMRIATWNANSLYTAGKLANVTKMEIMKLNILAISDLQ